jgi:hypothetical protein
MSDEYSIKKKHSITKYSVSHLSNNTPHIQFKIQKAKLINKCLIQNSCSGDGSAHYRLMKDRDGL